MDQDHIGNLWGENKGREHAEQESGQGCGVEEEGREDAALSSLGKKNLVSLFSPCLEA